MCVMIYFQYIKNRVSRWYHASMPETNTPPDLLTLTDEQQRIVKHDFGPALVFAVAGAGKTTTLVRRIERLVREGVFSPKRILATSFSRATVADLKRALGAFPHADRVNVKTLHGLSYEIIQDAIRAGLLHLKVPENIEAIPQGILNRTFSAARAAGVPFLGFWQNSLREHVRVIRCLAPIATRRKQKNLTDPPSLAISAINALAVLRHSTREQAHLLTTSNSPPTSCCWSSYGA